MLQIGKALYLFAIASIVIFGFIVFAYLFTQITGPSPLNPSLPPARVQTMATPTPMPPMKIVHKVNGKIISIETVN